MNEDERSGFVVSAIAVGGLGLFAVLTIPLWRAQLKPGWDR
jgi:hypothetical protein